ncbi:hypothetical protein C7M84_020413, partial [Penaeus vannamei]
AFVRGPPPSLTRLGSRNGSPFHARRPACARGVYTSAQRFYLAVTRHSCIRLYCVASVLVASARLSRPSLSLQNGKTLTLNVHGGRVFKTSDRHRGRPSAHVYASSNKLTAACSSNSSGSSNGGSRSPYRGSSPTPGHHDLQMTPLTVPLLPHVAPRPILTQRTPPPLRHSFSLWRINYPLWRDASSSRSSLSLLGESLTQLLAMETLPSGESIPHSRWTLPPPSSPFLPLLWRFSEMATAPSLTIFPLVSPGESFSLAVCTSSSSFLFGEAFLTSLFASDRFPSLSVRTPPHTTHQHLPQPATYQPHTTHLIATPAPLPKPPHTPSILLTPHTTQFIPLARHLPHWLYHRLHHLLTATTQFYNHHLSPISHTASYHRAPHNISSRASIQPLTRLYHPPSPHRLIPPTISSTARLIPTQFIPPTIFPHEAASYRTSYNTHTTHTSPPPLTITTHHPPHIPPHNQPNLIPPHTPHLHCLNTQPTIFPTRPHTTWPHPSSPLYQPQIQTHHLIHPTSDLSSTASYQHHLAQRHHLSNRLIPTLNRAPRRCPPTPTSKIPIIRSFSHPLLARRSFSGLTLQDAARPRPPSTPRVPMAHTHAAGRPTIPAALSAQQITIFDEFRRRTTAEFVLARFRGRRSILTG